MPHPLRKECGRYVLATHYLRLLGPIRDCAIRRWAPQVQGPYALHSTPTTGLQLDFPFQNRLLGCCPQDEYCTDPYRGSPGWRTPGHSARTARRSSCRRPPALRDEVRYEDQSGSGDLTSPLQRTRTVRPSGIATGTTHCVV